MCFVLWVVASVLGEQAFLSYNVFQFFGLSFIQNIKLSFKMSIFIYVENTDSAIGQYLFIILLENIEK